MNNDRFLDIPARKDPETCPHESFDARVEVNRIGEPVEFNVCLEVECTQCGTAFVFSGIPRQIDQREPSCSVFGTSVNLPIRPIKPEDRRGGSIRAKVYR